MKEWTLFMLFALLIGAVSCKNNSTSTTNSSAATDAIHQDESPSTPAAFTAEETEKYVNQGKSMAKASFMALSGQLKKAMKAGGPKNAVQFCHVQASVLVDSLMKAHQATIRRTTDKVRNENDKPTAAEAAQLASYKEQIAANQPLKPVVVPLEGNKVQFFAPIKMKAVCLKCHGTIGETMQKSDYETIKKLYPNDQAIGYKEGDFRGIWSIQFSR